MVAEGAVVCTMFKVSGILKEADHGSATVPAGSVGVVKAVLGGGRVLRVWFPQVNVEDEWLSDIFRSATSAEAQRIRRCETRTPAQETAKRWWQLW